MGRKKEEIRYVWELQLKLNKWGTVDKIVYEYDKNGNLLEQTKYDIYTKTEDMDSYPISEQISYTYNEKNNITAKNTIAYSQDRETKMYLLSWKELYELKGDTAVEKHYLYNRATKEWYSTPLRTDTYYFSEKPTIKK